jgi:xylulokinase
VAQRLGLKPGVPVACGIPDIHAAIIGSGATKAYETHLAVSTTAWFSAPAPFKRTDILHSIATLPGLTPDMNIVGNNIETGGAALSWLREQIIAPADGLLGGGSGIGADGAAPVGEQPTYEALTRLAESAPAGCEGLIFTPWLAGERSPIEDKHLRAAFLNLSFRSDRAMMVRAVMEGVALNINWLFTYYEKFLKRTVPSIRILGGGAQSDLWCSIIASTLDRRIEQVADPLNAQLRGVAMWARVCLGELTLEQAAAKVPVAQTFTPVPGEREVYAANFAEYRKLYGSVKGFYKRMNG